jgi:hypothetical protein
MELVEIPRAIRRASRFSAVFCVAALSSCGIIPSHTNTGNYDKNGDYLCRNAHPKPITVSELTSALRKSSIFVHSTDDSLCQDATVGFRIELENIIDRGPKANLGAEDKIVASQGYVRCTVTKRPIYRDEIKIVGSNLAEWAEYSYLNVGCGVTGLETRATPNQIRRLREAFVRLQRPQR